MRMQTVVSCHCALYVCTLNEWILTMFSLKLEFVSLVHIAYTKTTLAVSVCMYVCSYDFYMLTTNYLIDFSATIVCMVICTTTLHQKQQWPQNNCLVIKSHNQSINIISNNIWNDWNMFQWNCTYMKCNNLPLKCYCWIQSDQSNVDGCEMSLNVHPQTHTNTLTARDKIWERESLA